MSPAIDTYVTWLRHRMGGSVAWNAENLVDIGPVETRKFLAIARNHCRPVRMTERSAVESVGVENPMVTGQRGDLW